MISYDASALALSLLPASADPYTYHHLRRDIYALCTDAGVTIASRYTVPSAHLTIARFVTQADITSPAGTTEQAAIDNQKTHKLVDRIEELNAWLQSEYWPREGAGAGEWIVGEEVGLDCRKGTLWYGGGETVRLGTGF